jgi:hypothetical protein
MRYPTWKRYVLGQRVWGAPFEVVNALTAHSDKPAARMGFHDDGFLAGETVTGSVHPAADGIWLKWFGPGVPEFDYMTLESPYVPVDGELYWGDAGGKVDGLRAAIAMRHHHYTSFSIAHSYSEQQKEPYSIDDWMKTPLTAEQVRSRKLPVSDGYFEDDSGSEVARTQFEYLRDHLGYRLELQQARFPGEARAGGGFRVEVELMNRGFSVMHNPRPVYLVLIGRDGVAEFPVKEADPRKWQPYQPGDPEGEPLVHKLGLSSRLPRRLKPGRYRLGLWMPDACPSLRRDARYAVRVANRDVPWWVDADGFYGVNVLGEVQITR